MAFPESDLRRGRVIENGLISPTLDTSCEIGYIESATDELDPEQVKIRRLTPKECWRLQGFPDEMFERARTFVSDNQLYKQAGNSVTVDVIEAIANRINEVYDE